jgi:hypothetical protein
VKSKLLVLALSMFAMSFVAANGAVEAVIGTDAVVEVNADKEIAAEEAAKAKKAEEANAVLPDQESCSSDK